jgi:uncharacterized protein Yka (UPF0111/DUF47 family)
MIDKFFGFTRVQDEASIIGSLFEHTRIDEEEILLLKNMVSDLVNENDIKLTDDFETLKKINNTSSRIFEATAEQIIHANFDHQKQYDLLRLFQRIENISGSIIATAKRLVLLHKVDASLPSDLKEPTEAMAHAIVEIHELFRNALDMYQQNEKNLIHKIHEIIEMEHKIDNMRVNCIEILYKLGNNQSIQIGTFHAVENMIVHLEELAKKIKNAATSLEWLLIY